jgi:hypothetical protein
VTRSTSSLRLMNASSLMPSFNRKVATA